MLANFVGQSVIYIDSLPTIITRKHKGPSGLTFATAKIIQADFTLKPCFVVSDDTHKVHATTIHGALAALQRKKLAALSLQERAEAFLVKFPTLESSAKNSKLSEWHHTLTGSCQLGRDQFMLNNDIDPEERSTVREFIEKTKTAYGSDAILLLEKKYHGSK